MINIFKAQRAMMKELLDNEELVNITIITEDGGYFKVHLEFVVAMCSFIRCVVIFAKDTPLENILIPSVTKEVMANIINYIYTGQLKISKDKASDLAKAGKMLGMPHVIKLCKKYIISNLNKEHCLMVYTSLDYLQIPHLKGEVKPYVLRHFEQIFLVSNDYLNLDFTDVMDLLSSDKLDTSGEEYVFWATMRWVEHSPETRLRQLPILLRCIRFGLCNPRFYERNIVHHPYIKNHLECQAITSEASRLFTKMKHSSGGQPLNILLDMRHPFLRPRIPTEVLFVMGGWSAASARTAIETFDVKSGRWIDHDNRWQRLAISVSIPRAYHGMLWHKGYIYIMGGYNGYEFFNDVRRFNPETHLWEEKGCMNVQRCYVSVASLGNYIYAMGGFDGFRRNKSCERYDPELNQWKRMAEMNHVRSDAGADTLNGKIYIAGGFTGQRILNSVEFYDPETDTWTVITNMTSPRSGVKVSAYNNHLFIIGGYNGNERLQTVEKYNPRTKRWRTVPNMNGPRSNFATAVMYDCLYVIGGYNGHGVISLAECYDHRKNVWTPIAELNLKRSGLAACTITDIPNANDYTFKGNAPYLTYTM